MAEKWRRTPEPHDRLTRLADELLSALKARDDAVDVKAMVFLFDDRRGGIGISGYDNDTEALSDLLVHLHAMFKAQGKQFQIMTDDGSFLFD